VSGSVNKTSHDGCIFTVRPQVLPASHMGAHGTGVLAHGVQPEKGQEVCVTERERVCVDACVRACDIRLLAADQIGEDRRFDPRLLRSEVSQILKPQNSTRHLCYRCVNVY